MCGVAVLPRTVESFFEIYFLIPQNRVESLSSCSITSPVVLVCCLNLTELQPTQPHLYLIHHDLSFFPFCLSFFPSCPPMFCGYIPSISIPFHLRSISVHLNERAPVISPFNQIHYTFSMIQCLQFQAFKENTVLKPI